MRTLAVVVPAGSAVGDLSENALHARFVNHPDRATRAAARASTVLTGTKWLLAGGTVAALITRTLRRRRRGR